MFTTLKQRLETLATTRHQLATHYLAMATLTTCPRTRVFLERLADEEHQLADGLWDLARSPHVALKSWVQFPRRLPPVPRDVPEDLAAVVALSKEVDDAMIAMCKPLCSSGSHAIREWSDALQATLAARERNRSSVLALES